MPKTKRTVDVIIHLALMYAIWDRQEYARGVAPPPEEYGPERMRNWEETNKEYYDDALSEIEDMQAYHEKRYGYRI